MIDVILYKPSTYGLVFIHDKPLGFIIFHIKHERAYVSYNEIRLFVSSAHIKI